MMREREWEAHAKAEQHAEQREREREREREHLAAYWSLPILSGTCDLPLLHFASLTGIVLAVVHI